MAKWKNQFINQREFAPDWLKKHFSSDWLNKHIRGDKGKTTQAFNNQQKTAVLPAWQSTDFFFFFCERDVKQNIARYEGAFPLQKAKTRCSQFYGSFLKKKPKKLLALCRGCNFSVVTLCYVEFRCQTIRISE